MSNKLTSSKYPFLPLTIHVRVSNRKNIDINTQALIDTGFSGDIVVPITDGSSFCTVDENSIKHFRYQDITQEILRQARIISPNAKILAIPRQ